jgi:hypothetical protein
MYRGLERRWSSGAQLKRTLAGLHYEVEIANYVEKESRELSHLRADGY